MDVPHTFSVGHSDSDLFSLGKYGTEMSGEGKY